MTETPLRIAAFASGGGSNLQALLDAVDTQGWAARFVLCISNRPDAGALERARRHGMPAETLDPASWPDPDAYTTALLDLLAAHEVNFVVLAGYLKQIPPAVVRRFKGRMLNIHPALLPAFGGRGMYGRRVHQAVLDYGARWTGATVHLVDEDYDTGPVVLQEPVPVLPGDTADTLAARVLETEHRLYPEALRLFADGRVRLDGRRVLLLETAPADPSATLPDSHDRLEKPSGA